MPMAVIPQRSNAPLAISAHTHVAILIDHLQDREIPNFWLVFADVHERYAHQFAAFL